MLLIYCLMLPLLVPSPLSLLCSLFIQSLHLLSLHSEDQTLKIHLPWDRWLKKIEDENLKIITRSGWRHDEVHRFNDCGEIILKRRWNYTQKKRGHQAHRMGRSDDLSSWHRISEGSCHGQTSIHRCELVAHGHIASWQPQHGKTAMKESSLPLHYINLYTPLLHSPQVANLQMSVIHYFIP